MFIGRKHSTDLCYMHGVRVHLATCTCIRVKNKITNDRLFFLSGIGAILFEGFDVNEGIEFQEIVQSFNPNLSDEYRGTSPRKLIQGTKVPIYTYSTYHIIIIL